MPFGRKRGVWFYSVLKRIVWFLLCKLAILLCPQVVCVFCVSGVSFVNSICFVSRYRVILKEWRVFECSPIFKVLLDVGVDFVSICRNWARFARLSLLYTVLVKYWGRYSNEFSSRWAIFMCLPDCYFRVVSYGHTLLLSMSY